MYDANRCFALFSLLSLCRVSWKKKKKVGLCLTVEMKPSRFFVKDFETAKGTGSAQLNNRFSPLWPSTVDIIAESDEAI